jgi:hypothetical protein
MFKPCLGIFSDNPETYCANHGSGDRHHEPAFDGNVRKKYSEFGWLSLS